MTASDGRRVLVVGAVDASVELRSLGYDVCDVVTTAEAAIAAAARCEPDLVLMDVRLSDGGDGIELARRIGEHRDLPIVFLADRSDDATLRRALDVSTFGYLLRPFRAHDLRISLDVALAKRRRDASTLVSLTVQATTDPLTGLANRRRLDEVLEREWTRCRHEGLTLAVLALDIDRFKQLNDLHGHQAGDACLVTVAAAIRRGCTRAGSVACRWGGDEFLVILPATESAVAESMAHDLLEAVRTSNSAAPHDTPLTVSIGIAAATPTFTGSPDELISAADRALYEAKRRGPGQAMVAALR